VFPCISCALSRCVPLPPLFGQHLVGPTAHRFVQAASTELSTRFRRSLRCFLLCHSFCVCELEAGEFRPCLIYRRAPFHSAQCLGFSPRGSTPRSTPCSFPPLDDRSCSDHTSQTKTRARDIPLSCSMRCLTSLFLSSFSLFMFGPSYLASLAQTAPTEQLSTHAGGSVITSCLLLFCCKLTAAVSRPCLIYPRDPFHSAHQCPGFSPRGSTPRSTPCSFPPLDDRSRITLPKREPPRFPTPHTHNSVSLSPLSLSLCVLV